MAAGCDLCEADGGDLLYRHPKFRVVRVTGVDGEAFTGFCRVVWNEHVKEMTDLESEDRGLFMGAVYRVESALRLSLNPDKMNLASLGNMTPHLHWHVIPRFNADIAFPKPVWAVNLPAAGGKAMPVDPAGTHKKDSVTRPDWENAIRRAFSTG
jgi:diadenosine tetraphosphate (Ap4A) HIT family hydrolase